MATLVNRPLFTLQQSGSTDLYTATVSGQVRFTLAELGDMSINHRYVVEAVLIGDDGRPGPSNADDDFNLTAATAVGSEGHTGSDVDTTVSYSFRKQNIRGANINEDIGRDEIYALVTVTNIDRNLPDGDLRGQRESNTIKVKVKV